jgi:hypothetical protein
MVILNKSEKEETLDLKQYREILTEPKGKDVITGKTLTLENTLKVPSKTVYVLELDKD